MSILNSLLNAGRSALPSLARFGIKNADDLAGRLMPAVLQTGDRVLVERTTNALRNLGARVPSLPGPGLLGPQRASSAVRPAPSQLPQSIRGFVGPSPTPPPARAAVPATPAPGVRGVPALAQNRPPAPLAEAPTPPVRYPAPAPASETARQITMLKPGPNEVGSMGTRLTYRAGTPGVDGRLGSTTYGQGAEIGASSVYPRIPAGASAQEQMRLSSQLNRGPSTAELPGTPLLRTQGSNQYVAPRAAFGPGAGPAPVDPVCSCSAFARNAASGAELVDLGALLSNPAFRVAAGAGGLGLFVTGVAGMMSGDRTGETTAGSPPSLPPTLLCLPKTDGSPLGAAAPGVLAPPAATGNIDPSVAAPTVTGGNLQQQSATREALAQHAPGAAAVMRASEPMSPERYGSIEDYYAARAAYAGSADKQRELMRFMEGQSQTLGKSLAEWAESNPALAYEFQRRQLVNQAANQQSAEAVTTRNYGDFADRF
jgi:hypothetical protein